MMFSHVELFIKITKHPNCGFNMHTMTKKQQHTVSDDQFLKKNID